MAVEARHSGGYRTILLHLEPKRIGISTSARISRDNLLKKKGFNSAKYFSRP
jgi:hypothetical protein